jgi:hypothetical protein
VDEPYSYTQFMEHYHRRYARTAGSIKLEHILGHEVFLDFAGVGNYDRENVKLIC